MDYRGTTPPTELSSPPAGCVGDYLHFRTTAAHIYTYDTPPYAHMYTCTCIHAYLVQQGVILLAVGSAGEARRFLV